MQIRIRLTQPSARPAKAAAATLPFAFADAKIGRHQGCVQRSLGERAPRHIDELEGDQKSVRDRTCSE